MIWLCESIIIGRMNAYSLLFHFFETILIISHHRVVEKAVTYNEVLPIFSVLFTQKFAETVNNLIVEPRCSSNGFQRGIEDAHVATRVTDIATCGFYFRKRWVFLVEFQILIKIFSPLPDLFQDFQVCLCRSSLEASAKARRQNTLSLSLSLSLSE